MTIIMSIIDYLAVLILNLGMRSYEMCNVWLKSIILYNMNKLHQQRQLVWYYELGTIIETKIYFVFMFVYVDTCM